MEREHELTAALSAGTRYQIYRAIAEHPGTPVTVLEMAQRFHLHPNVARMHLGKLEQAGLLTTALRRGTGGGRPAKLYTLNDRAMHFDVPPRRYQLLSDLAVSALAAAGGDEEIDRVCREAGLQEGRRYLAESGARRRTSRTALLNLVRGATEAQGMLPEVTWQGDKLRLDVRNCVFREVSGVRPEVVCTMHRAYLRGFLESLGGTMHVVNGATMSRGAERCQVLVSFS